MLLIILLPHTEHILIWGPGFGSPPAIRSINQITEAGSEYSGDEKTLIVVNPLLYSFLSIYVHLL